VPRFSSGRRTSSPRGSSLLSPLREEPLIYRCGGRKWRSPLILEEVGGGGCLEMEEESGRWRVIRFIWRHVSSYGGSDAGVWRSHWEVEGGGRIELPSCVSSGTHRL